MTPDDRQKPMNRDADPSIPKGVRAMATLRWALVAMMALIATGAVLSHFGAFERAGEHSHQADTLYYCPMHPQIVQDHPGTCPICNMTLVPKPQGAVEPSATMKPGIEPAAASPTPVPGLVAVDIPFDRVQKIGVRTARAVTQTLTGDFQTVGVVEANERALAQVSPRFSGWIESLAVSETGQLVKRGQTLATIYSPDVLQAQQELITALGWGQNAENALSHHAAPLQGLVADARRRLELLGIAAYEIALIEKQGKPQRAIAIRSPVDGHVIAKNAVVGMSVSPGTPLFEVANLSTVWAVAEIYESDISRVRIGQAARFQVAAYPQETFTGKVRFVYPTVDPSSRTVRVRMEFRNRPGPGGLKLRPGMYGNVFLDLPATKGLMVPAEAVVDTGDVQYLFVAKVGGRFEPRRVKVGMRVSDHVQILEGVVEGETVVTTANFLIDSESRLRAAIEGQSAQASDTAASSAAGQGPSCQSDFDEKKYPDKYQACRACEIQHRGMGTMEEDCKKAIAKPWR